MDAKKDKANREAVERLKAGIPRYNPRKCVCETRMKRAFMDCTYARLSAHRGTGPRAFCPPHTRHQVSLCSAALAGQSGTAFSLCLLAAPRMAEQGDGLDDERRMFAEVSHGPHGVSSAPHLSPRV